MRQYQVEMEDGAIKKMSHIGVNYNSNNGNNDIISSYDKVFDNNDEIIIMDQDNIYYCTLGNIMEAYILLRNSIASKKPRDFREYINCVQEVITTYFGNSYSVTKRIKSLNNHKNHYSVSDLVHENSAIGIERAMLAQNLLWEVAISSVYKIGLVLLNGKPTIHAYNIISYNGKNYIFDSTIPTVNDGFISPLICEISDDLYKKIIMPVNTDGLNLEISHINPLKNKDINIVYDVDSRLTIEKGFTKIKKV